MKIQVVRTQFGTDATNSLVFIDDVIYVQALFLFLSKHI